MVVDSCAGVDSWLGVDSFADPDSPEALDCGAWAGGCRDLEELVEVPLDSLELRWEVESAERCAALDAVVAFTVLPGKALAATAVSTPVRAVLPAISQRLERASLRRAASRVRVV